MGCVCDVAEEELVEYLRWRKLVRSEQGVSHEPRWHPRLIVARVGLERTTTAPQRQGTLRGVRTAHI